MKINSWIITEDEDQNQQPAHLDDGDVPVVDSPNDGFLSRSEARSADLNRREQETMEELVTCDGCDAISESGWGDNPFCLDCSPADEICELHQRTFDTTCPLCEEEL